MRRSRALSLYPTYAMCEMVFIQQLGARQKILTVQSLGNDACGEMNGAPAHPTALGCFSKSGVSDQAV